MFGCLGQVSGYVNFELLGQFVFGVTSTGVEYCQLTLLGGEKVTVVLQREKGTDVE